MGLLAFFRSFWDPEFPPGTVFYVTENGEYAVYKILRFGKEGLFVKAFWPETAVPAAGSWRDLDLRNACEAFDVARLEHAVVLDREAVSEEEERSYAEFLRIEDGIRQRAERMETLQREAGGLLEQERFEEAAALYTEAASFSKYYFQTFGQRGYCYLKLGRFSEAVADLEHALSIFPESKDTLYHCAMAYRGSGNAEKANEKLAMLRALDPDHAGLAKDGND